MQNTIKNEIFSETPETRNGLMKMIKMVKSTGHKRLRVNRVINNDKNLAD